MQGCEIQGARCRLQHVLCRVQGAEGCNMVGVQSAGRMLQDAVRKQDQDAGCRVQDTCRLQGAAGSGVQEPEWRVRSVG